MRNLRSMLTIGFLPLIIAACDASALDQDIENTDDKFATTSKANGDLTDCETATILSFVNNIDTDVDALKLAGVHTRASKNIVAARNGADAAPGTADDVLFADLEQLDDVYYVGPAAMEQLRLAVVASCNVAEVAPLDVIFSPQAYWDSHLGKMQELLDGADNTVDIAMYSFGDGGLMDAIEHAVDRGVRVRMVFNSALKDKKSPAGTRSARLESMGVDVRYINKIMHHKYAIIDGPQLSVEEAATGILASGSGNWSYSAGTKYDENTVFHYGNERLNMLYQQEFNHLWGNSRDLVWDATLAFGATMTVTDNMIPADPSVDAVFTSANMRTYVSKTYGPTFSVISGLNTVSDRLVSIIDSAEDSIWIASGHLRSRPIAEAVIAATERNPALDVRVYLDGQEFTSQWLHDKQGVKLEECLVKAGTSTSKKQRCMDVGFKFGMAMHNAPGVDLRYKYYSFRWDYTYAAQMHHKYLLVDSTVLATGSYNYSDNAEHNTIENCAIYNASAYPELVDRFRANFLSMWNTRTDGEFEAKMAEITEGDDSFSIVWDAMALDTDQVSALKTAIRAHCPDVDSEEWRKNPGKYKVCHR